MPRCDKCNGCLNHSDGFNCEKCKWCLDSKRNGGPNKLRRPCKFRRCVKFQGGKEVERMSSQFKSKLKRKRKVVKSVERRDSGIEQDKVTGNSKMSDTIENKIGVEGTGRDSGVGSHDGEGRDWGRRVSSKTESKLISRLALLAGEFAQTIPGQVTIVHKPSDHPNIPGLREVRNIVVSPGIEEHNNIISGNWRIPGDNLVKLGLDESDVLSCRMPELQPGCQVVASVSLGIDLTRIGNKQRRNKDRVVTWLFALLELSFPDKLRSSAVSMVWNMLEENFEYMGECEDEEADNFALSSLELPEDVVEMASILEENIPESPSRSPISASQLDLTGLSLNTTALDNAVSSLLPGQPVHGEDANYSYTATVLDMDIDSFTSLMTPNRISSDQLVLQPEFTGYSDHEHDLFVQGNLMDYPPLPVLPGNLEITPVSPSSNHRGLPPGSICEIKPETLLELNDNRCKTESVEKMVDAKTKVPSTLIPLTIKLEKQESRTASSTAALEADESIGRPEKRARREPSRYKDFTSPVLK